eukprot:222525_1
MSKFLFSLISLLLSTKADFKSYDGSNCGYVYDADRESTYPLDKCITDYDQDHSIAQFKSRQYVCTLDDEGNADIEVFTYYAQNCTGNADETASALGPENNAYQCGDGESATYDACYVEYIQYDVGASNTTCETWETANFETKFVTVGACVPAVRNTYSRCDLSGDSTDVQYVEFIDDECCDLAYTYTGSSGPDWKTMAIQTGCDSDNGVFIDPASWNCFMDENADDEDVFTTNMDKQCTDDAPFMAVSGVVMSVIAAAMSFY